MLRTSENDQKANFAGTEFSEVGGTRSDRIATVGAKNSSLAALQDEGFGIRSLSSRICSGPMPQQPPTSCTPIPVHPWACFAKSSGEMTSTNCQFGMMNSPE